MRLPVKHRAPALLGAAALSALLACSTQEPPRPRAASDVTSVSTLVSADVNTLGDGNMTLDSGVTLLKVTEFTWVFQAKNPAPGANHGVSANAGLFVAGTHAFVLDTLWNDEQFESVLGYLERHGVTVDLVLLTHAHQDRVGGLGAVMHHKIKVFARRETAARVELRGFRATPIEDRDRIAFEGESIEVLFPGPAHTNDNVVAFRSRDSVLYAGCAIKEKTAETLGFIEEADLERWPEALFHIEKAFPRTMRIIPGHGEPGGRDLFAHTKELLRQDD